jgi:hypothetical protein
VRPRRYCDVLPRPLNQYVRRQASLLTPEDALVLETVRRWLDRLPTGTATLLEKEGTSTGPPSVRITPSRSGALSVGFWVGDEPYHLSVRVGEEAWWDQQPLSAEFIESVCEAVARGQAFEETRHWGQRRIAWHFTLPIAGRDSLQACRNGLLSLLPIGKWTRRDATPWA